jgi:hypothetical protein
MTEPHPQSEPEVTMVKVNHSIGCKTRKRRASSRKRSVTAMRSRESTYTRNFEKQDSYLRAGKRPFRFRG